MAGIDTDEQEAGFKNIIIKPHIGEGVWSSRASYNSKRGLIKSEWLVNNKTFNLVVSSLVIFVPIVNLLWQIEEI